MSSGPHSMTWAVIEAVAIADNIEPEGLEPSLYEVIDPDALNALFRGTKGEVTFEYAGYLVTVDNQSCVDLDPIEME